MHTCPNCGYCPHCGRSNPQPMRPAPWWYGKPIWIAPYPGWGGTEVGYRTTEVVGSTYTLNRSATTELH